MTEKGYEIFILHWLNNRRQVDNLCHKWYKSLLWGHMNNQKNLKVAKNPAVKTPVKGQQPKKVSKSTISSDALKVGDNAVYPGHGVGRVLSIDTKEILGIKHAFFTIEILETGMKIMIPANNLANVGLRPIISETEAQKVITILKTNEVKVDNQTWNRRYREYMEKIKTGSVFEIAEVLRDLFLLKVDKELSFGERKLLDTARSLLLKELRLASKSSNFEEEQEIKDIFGLQ